MNLTPAGMRDWWNKEAASSAKTAIISNRADMTDEAFFASGAAWLDEFAAFARLARIDLHGTMAVDFGCGMGRMTRALSTRYERVIGIDVSDEMVRLASEARSSDKTEFMQVLEAPWPIGDRSAELAFSTIAIQHIPEPYNERAVDELFRISSKLVLFDAPSHKLSTDDADPSGSGIFFAPFRTILGIAEGRGFELIALRDFPTTATRQYQYLFKAK